MADDDKIVGKHGNFEDNSNSETEANVIDQEEIVNLVNDEKGTSPLSKNLKRTYNQ